MSEVTIELLRSILAGRCLSVPHVYSDNRQDGPYVSGHELAVEQIIEIIDNGWNGGDTPRLRHELQREMPHEGALRGK